MGYLALTAVLISASGRELDRITDTSKQVETRIKSWLTTICHGDTIHFVVDDVTKRNI